MKEPEGSIEPFLAPPLPPKGPALTGFGQVASNLRLHRVSDIRKAPARVTHSKIVHPATQNGVDLFDHLPRGLRAKNQLELASNAVRFLARGIYNGIHPAECGYDGTQILEIPNSLLAADPPSDSSP